MTSSLQGSPAATTAAGDVPPTWPMDLDDLLDLLDQEEIWVGRDNTVHQVDVLSFARLAALHRYLERKTPELRAEHARAILTLPDDPDCIWAAGMTNAVMWESERPDSWWIADQPLYQRIGELLGDRRFEPGVCRECRGAGETPTWAGGTQPCAGCYRPPVNLRHFTRDIRRLENA